MRFDLTDLRLFMNIVEAGTITGGAARSHMTLASASERVIGMESSLKTALLVRHRQGVQVTEAGRALAHHARLILEQMERLRGELGDYGAGLQGHVRVRCNTSAMTEHLPRPLGAFLTLHPRVSVDLEEMPSLDIVDALRAGRCDIGIVSDAVDVEGLAHVFFRGDPLQLVVPRGHILARRRRVTLAEVVNGEFVGLAEPSALADHLAAHARRLGKRLAYRVRVRSFEALCGMVEQGIGIGIVPRAVAERCAATMRIVHIALSDAWADRQLLACYKQGNDLPLHARRLLTHLSADAET